MIEIMQTVIIKKEVKLTIAEYKCAKCGKTAQMVAEGKRNLCLECFKLDVFVRCTHCGKKNFI